MTNEELDRRLKIAINWCFAGLVFLLPLVLSTRSSEVFELPKMLFVYAMTAVIVGLWLGRMLVRRERRTFLREILIRRTPLDIPILLFLISQMVSTIYSIDPQVAWWGWYGRFHGGLISTISYTLLYYAFVSNYSAPSSLPVIGSLFSVFGFKSIGYQSIGHKPVNRKPADQNPTTDNGKLMTVILASALVVSVYAILQHFGVDRDFWVQDVVNRVFSTQGQPNWLAGYLVMAIPLGWAMAIAKEEGRRKKEEGLGMTAFYLLPFTFYLALLWTKSRSGLVGLAVADGVFWLATLAKLKVKSEKLKVFRQFVLIHVLMAGLILATNNPAREWMLGRLQVTGYRRQETTIPAMETGITLRKSEHGGTESGDIRAVVWNGAIQLVKQRPIFGFGPETFGETYWLVRPKEHNLTSEWNFLYNKAHNEWLNLAANTGLFGLGSHLLMLGWFGVWSLKTILNHKHQAPNPKQAPITKFQSTKRILNFGHLNFEFVWDLGFGIWNLAALAAVVGVEAVNFFGFSTVTVGVYRYLFMGMAVVGISDIRNHKSYRQTKTSSERINMISYFLFMISSIAVLYLLSQLFIFFLADLAYNRGRAYQDAGYIEEAVEPLMQAVNLAPGEPVFRAELGEAEGIFASLINQKSDIINHKDELINQLKNDSMANFEIIRRQSPYNLGFIKTEAKVLFLLGNCAESPGDDLCERAIQLMKLAAEMAPTNPQLPYSLGQMVSKIGKEEEAAVYYNKAVELKPDYQEAIKILNTEY